jgi:hypothetical protein
MQYNCFLCHSLLDLLSVEIKKHITCSSLMVNLAQKLNRFTVKDYFDKLKKKKLLMLLVAMDNTERIYIVDGKGYRSSFFFL